MVLPLLPAIIGHGARIGITAKSAKAFGGQFAQSLPFGVGYSAGTYIGFPGNYQNKFRGKSYKPITLTLNEKKGMAYGRQRKWYSTYKTRWFWKPVFHRKLRRMVYTHPNRRY